MKTRIKLTFFLCIASLLLATSNLSARDFFVSDFGAKGDGEHLDTDAINAAIEAAAAVGGGTVRFAAGEYLSYSIRLRSHVTLQLGSGVTITAADPSPDFKQGYDAPEECVTPEYQDFGHSHWRNSLIWGEDLQDVAIIGPGLIFGRGLSDGYSNWKHPLPEERYSDNPPDVSLPKEFLQYRKRVERGPFGYPGRDWLPAGVGNKAIALKNCRNVVFRDFSIYHGGHFGIIGTGVSNWTIDNLLIDTNRDGIDIDGCVNVRVSNCSVNSPYDDGICLKSSYGLGRPLPCENITITGCYLSGFDEGSLLDGTRTRKTKRKGGNVGRIKLGTESNGTYRNIAISNCIFEHCRGLAMMSVDGALLEDVVVSNIVMREIQDVPIFLRLASRLRGPEGTDVGAVRRIRISNLSVYDSSSMGGMLISGIPGHCIEDVRLSDISLHYAGGGTAEQGLLEVPEGERRYPETDRFGILPGWGVFARHVKGLWLDGVEMSALSLEQRPAVHLENVVDVSVDQLRRGGEAEGPVFQLKRVSEFKVTNSYPVEDAAVDRETEFLRL